MSDLSEEIVKGLQDRPKPIVSVVNGKKEAIITINVAMRTTLRQIILAEAAKVRNGMITVKDFYDWLDAAEQTIADIKGGLNVR